MELGTARGCDERSRSASGPDEGAGDGRILRHRAVLAGEGVREGFEDLAAGRVVPLTDDLLDEIAAASQGKKRSKSS